MSREDIQKACRLGDVEVINSIVKLFPDCINDLDSKLGWAPLYRTVICGHLEATAYLLALSADPNIQNRLGEAPLHQAADNNQLEIAQLLLQHNADPNVQQNDGDTPLHHAAFKGYAQIVQLLVQHGADPNTANFVFGKAPLHLAAENGHSEAVRALLAASASAQAKDRHGKIAADSVSSGTVLELLRSAGPKLTVAEKFLEDPGSVLEPECERVSANAGGKHSTFSFGGSQNPLFLWLQAKRLEFLFEGLFNNGFDDLDLLLYQMKNGAGTQVTLELLQQGGVKKPGHRAVLLALLEEECAQATAQDGGRVSADSLDD